MAVRSVGIRLGTEGKAQVVADLEAIGRTGDAAFDRIAKRAKRSGEDAQAAIAKAERDMRKLETLMPGLNPGKLDMNVGIRDNIGKSAESSAAVFSAAFAKMEQRAEHLREVIDPLYAAQKRHNAAIGEAQSLMAAGVLSLDDYSKMAWHLHQSLNGVAETQGKTVDNTGKLRQAMAGATFQVQDFITQVSMGGNPLNALMVQGGQLAGQFMYVEGRAGALARFFMGPWGLAIQIAMAVAAPFVGKLFEAATANDKASAASKRHAEALEKLRDAVERLNGQQAIRNHNTRQGIQDDLNAAEAARQHEVRVRGLLDAQLRQAKQRLDAARALQQNTGGTAPGLLAGGAGLLANQAQGQITAIEGAIKINDQKRQQAEEALRVGARQIMMRDIAGATDAATKANQRYEDTMDRISRQFDAGKISQTVFQRLATDAEKAKQKALDLAKETDKVVRDADTLTSSQVAKMLRGALPGVQVTSTTGGKHVKNSYHYRNQAVDFVPEGGMSSMTKADVRRIFESRGIEIVELLGPGDKGHSDHFHVAWTKGKQSLDEFNDAAKRTQSQMKLLDDALAGARGLDMDAIINEQRQRYNDAVRKLVGDTDPLAGKIATGQEIVANDNADREVEQRRLALGKDRIQSLAGYYLQLFNGGTGSIWDLFRQQGLRTLSDLLAKWTLGKAGDGAGGLLGSLGSLFGGGGNAADTALGASITSQANAALAGLPKLASGTQYWSGGAALLGEHGPERAWLPRGTRVTSAGETRRAANDTGGGPTIINVHANDAVLASTVREWVAEGVAIASTRGAAGGAAMAEAEGAATAARRLGRRW